MTEADLRILINQYFVDNQAYGITPAKQRDLSQKIVDFIISTPGSSFPYISEAGLLFTDITTANSTTSKHGLLPKLNGLVDQFLNGNGAWSYVRETALSFTDIVNANASTSSHGLMPKFIGDASKYFRGDGTWATPSGTGLTTVIESNLSFTDITTADFSITQHGLMKKANNITTSFMRGDANWASVTDSVLSFTDLTVNNSTTSRHGLLPKLGGGSTNFLRADGTWATPPGTGLTTVIESNLSFTDITTANSSTSLHGLMPKLGGDQNTFINGVGQWVNVSEPTFSFTDITTANSTTSKHGLLPKLGGGSTNFLRADGTWATPPGTGLTTVIESNLLFTDITTANSTTSQHGLLPKLGGGSTNFLRADGTWATPPGTGLTTVIESNLSFTDITTANATTSQHGLLKKLDNDTTHFMRGDGAWAVPAFTGFIDTIPFQDSNTGIGNNTYVLELYAWAAYTISAIKVICDSGTCNLAIQINGTNVTGISAVAVSSTIATGTASGANSVAIGNKITMVLSSTSSLANLVAAIKIVYS